MKIEAAWSFVVRRLGADFNDPVVALEPDRDLFRLSVRCSCCRQWFSTTVTSDRALMRKQDKEAIVDAFYRIEDAMNRDGCRCRPPVPPPIDECWAGIYGAAWGAP